MPSDRTEYHDDIIHAHRQAIAALRELLATEENRTERRRLATTLLRARPLKEAALPSPRSGREGAAGFAAADEGFSESVARRDTAANSNTPNDNLDNPNHPVNRKLAAITHEAKHGPDHLGALRKLEAIMKGDFSALTPASGMASSS